MVECVNVSYDNSPITALNRASDTYDKNFDVILPYVNTVFTFSLVFFKVTYYDGDRAGVKRIVPCHYWFGKINKFVCVEKRRIILQRS